MAESVRRLSEYEKAQNRYQELLSGSDKFKNLVEKQLGEKTNYNKDLIDQQQRLMEKQLSLPSQLRSEFSGGPIRNPLAQEALIQQRASNVGQQLGSVSDLLGARGQRQNDMLNSALSTYQTRLTGEQTAAEAAWRMYQDALAREEAARARAAAAAQSGWIEDLLNQGTGGGNIQQQEVDYRIPVTAKTKTDLLTGLSENDLRKSFLGNKKASATAGASIARAREDGGSLMDYYKNYFSGGSRALNPLYGVTYGSAALTDLVKKLFKK
jgi:hypothetical protein